MNDVAFKKLISGEHRGLAASLGRFALATLSPFYSAATRLRNVAFDVGIKRTRPASVPVISVGNITAGGTGKTPVVALIANLLTERHERVCLLSRGYRALPGEVNDEKLLLDQLCPGVPHIQNPSRVEGARVAIDEHQASVLLLDDGFQHRWLKRDLDIVLIDATCPFGYGHVLPRGLLREAASSVSRADLLVVTRADQVEDTVVVEIVKRLKQFAPDCPVLRMAFQPTNLVRHDGKTQSLESLAGKRIGAFCGIGNPDAFRESLASVGCEPVAFRTFADHHHYDERDVVDLACWLKESDCNTAIATEKDLVKLPHDAIGDVPLFALRIAATVQDDGLRVLSQHLDNLMSSAREVS